MPDPNEVQTLRDIAEALEEGRPEDAQAYANNRLWIIGHHPDQAQAPVPPDLRKTYYPKTEN